MSLKTNTILGIMILLALTVSYPGMAKTHEGSSSQQVNLDLAIINLPADWHTEVSQKIFGEPVTLFQHRVHKRVLGNVLSILKVTKPKENFDSVTTLKKECEFYKEVYEKLTIENTTYKVEFTVQNPEFPLCWVKRESHTGNRVNVILFTKRQGKTADYSYMAHTFTFSYPYENKAEGQVALEQFFGDIRYQGQRK